MLQIDRTLFIRRIAHYSNAQIIISVSEDSVPRRSIKEKVNESNCGLLWRLGFSFASP